MKIWLDWTLLKSTLDNYQHLMNWTRHHTSTSGRIKDVAGLVNSKHMTLLVCQMSDQNSVLILSTAVMMYVLERVSGFEVCFEGEFTSCFKVLPFVNGELFMSVCSFGSDLCYKCYILGL